MTIATHCLPNGSLGTDELGIPGINANSITTVHATTGVGNRRGIVVMCHGLETGTFGSVPPGLVDGGTIGFEGYYSTFANMVAADGWEVINVLYQEDTYDGSPAQGFYNDISNDSGNGLRYLNSTLHWWDHIKAYIAVTYGSNWPIVIFGVSHGGAKSLEIVGKHPKPQLTAFIAHAPAACYEPASTTYVSLNFGGLNWSGIDLTPTSLNSTTLPGIIGVGTNDIAIGCTTTTVASGSNSLTAAQVASAGNLYLASITNFQTAVRVLVTGLSGGTGQAVFAFSGTSSSGGNHLTGVTLISGSGTLATGNYAIQNLGQILVTNQNAAQPSNKVTLNLSSDGHELTKSDAGIYTTPTGISGNVALTTLTGTLNVGATASGGLNWTNLVSGSTAIQDTTGTWHTMTWTGSTGTTLTGVSYSGSNTATVNNSSAICQTNFAVGGSYPYWMSQNVDPSCPKIY